MKEITVIHCWSAPRSRSTALLYSFEARGENDCVALDEPLYREWLKHHGDSVARPYHKELIEGIPPADSPQEAEIWKRELLSLEERIQNAVERLSDGGVVFCKHMAKHSFLYNFDQEVTLKDANISHRHMLLIRDPVDVLSAWEKVGKNHGNVATTDEVGIVPLLSIYSRLESSNRSSGNQFLPVVLESNELALDPKAALSHICDNLSIPFLESMLTWKSGPHTCDGPWAKVRS